MLCHLEVGCLHLSAFGGNIEGYPLAFVERRKAGTFDRADVNEHVRAAIVRLNEAETLLRIESLHFACRHHVLPISMLMLELLRKAL